jgi:excisionase family DNA binding protein
MVYLRSAAYDGGMSHLLATFDPDDIRDSRADAGVPGWAKTLFDRVREAAASGQTVTVTAEERMLTPEQMACRIGVHRSTIARKILAGEIRALKVGNRHRVPYSEFQRYREEMLDRSARASAPDVEAELFDG